QIHRGGAVLGDAAALAVRVAADGDQVAVLEAAHIHAGDEDEAAAEAVHRVGGGVMDDPATAVFLKLAGDPAIVLFMADLGSEVGADNLRAIRSLPRVGGGDDWHYGRLLDAEHRR